MDKRDSPLPSQVGVYISIYYVKISLSYIILHFTVMLESISHTKYYILFILCPLSPAHGCVLFQSNVQKWTIYSQVDERDSPLPSQVGIYISACHVIFFTHMHILYRARLWLWIWWLGGHLFDQPSNIPDFVEEYWVQIHVAFMFQWQLQYTHYGTSTVRIYNLIYFCNKNNTLNFESVFTLIRLFWFTLIFLLLKVPFFSFGIIIYNDIFVGFCLSFWK